jgi:hypothetical protein
VIEWRASSELKRRGVRELKRRGVRRHSFAIYESNNSESERKEIEERRMDAKNKGHVGTQLYTHNSPSPRYGGRPPPYQTNRGVN